MEIIYFVVIYIISIYGIHATAFLIGPQYLKIYKIVIEIVNWIVANIGIYYFQYTLLPCHIHV